MGVVKLADYRHNPVQHQEASSMGYVSIHRQFMDSRLYKDSQAVHLWLHLILKANHEATVQSGITHRTAISGRGWKKPLSSAYNSDRR